MIDLCHKPSLRLTALLGAALCLASAPVCADPAELPMRKAGLWQLTTVMDEGAGPREHAFKMCVDADMERNTVHASLIEHKQSCATYDVKSQNGVTTVDADCVFNSANVHSRTEMSGDFKQAFVVTIQSTTIPLGSSQSRPVKRTIKQSGTFLGESCGDVGPGEAMTNEGNKFVVQ